MGLGICKNDRVVVISGKFKGSRGKVLDVDRAKQRALVEGVNFRTHHERMNPQTGQGGRVEKEAPIHLSNLALECPKTGKPTRIRHRVTEVETPGGKRKKIKERISVRAERELGEAVVIPRER
ncbi:MAG: 50S ribosomal protein L24 [Candidatus Sumerlaeia bacterium]|nr:50S ribosomal protein L24 [Candidatus Sumerlaeia bacterium]